MTHKKTFLLALCASLAWPVSGHAQQVWQADNGDGTFTNPLLWGDWPDPDVIRVGDTFYMVSTSMHYVPGCPVIKSKDLVNWEMASYAVDRYDEDPRYDMQGGTLYLNGSWAASIRHHNGRFYVAFCTPYGWGTEKGNFCVCEAEKAEGPWTRTVFPDYLYDPGLFFDDDGRVYVAHGQGTIYLTELNADARSVKSKAVEIWRGGFKDSHTLGGGFGMEGSHMYKINGMYYITCPAGGTGGWQICLRSKNIYGPYEHHLIMDDDKSYPGNGLHQGGMVQLKNGDWWFIIMQDRGAIGRVPCLVPVKWVDGWPMLGADGKDAIVYDKPATGKKVKPHTVATTDEFNTARLGLQWQWNHNPDPSRWSLAARKGYMRLTASKADDIKNARNTLTQRVQGPLSTATTEMDLAGLRDGNVAGMGIFEFPYAYIAVEQRDGARRLVMCNDGKEIDAFPLPAGQQTLWIRVFATDRDFKANFFYSLDGSTFHPFGNVLQMGLGLPWTANRFALFNFSTTEQGVGGWADFNWFRMAGSR